MIYYCLENFVVCSYFASFLTLKDPLVSDIGVHNVSFVGNVVILASVEIAFVFLLCSSKIIKLATMMTVNNDKISFKILRLFVLDIIDFLN